MSSRILDRCSMAVSSTGGTFLGTGAVVAANLVLTCAHVVAKRAQVQVSTKPGVDGVIATVESAGDLKGPFDVALLRLAEELPTTDVLSFGGWERGLRFEVSGWIVKDDDSSDRRMVDGTVQTVSPPNHDWIQLDPTTKDEIEPGCSGSPVWLPDRQQAAGLITSRRVKGTAFMIPTGMIEQQVGKLSSLRRRPEIADPIHLPNVGLSRFICLTDADGRTVGQGFRFDREHVVTLEQIVQPKDTVQWRSYDAGWALRNAFPPSDADPCRGTAASVYRLDGLTEDLPSFDLIEDCDPGQSWRAVCLAHRKHREPERIFLSGQTGLRDEQGHRILEIDSPADSSQSWIGAAVFIEIDGSWKWAGLLDRDTSDGKSRWLLLTPGTGQELDRLSTDGLPDDLAERYSAACIQGILRHLRKPQIAEKVAGSHASWEPALEHGMSALVDALVTQTPPEQLAQKLQLLHRNLANQGDTHSADAVFHVLMRTLPLCFRHHVETQWPEPTAVDLRFDFLFEEMVELAMAAGDGGEAVWESVVAGKHRPAHRIEATGEFGTDLGGLAAAADTMKGIADRIILSDPSDATRKASKLFSALGAQTGFDGVPLLPLDELEQLDEWGESKENRWQEMRAVLNERLREPNDRYGRRLYYMVSKAEADERDRQVDAVLRRWLPDLPFVTKRAGDHPYRRFSALLQSLKKLFAHRALPTNPTLDKDTE